MTQYLDRGGVQRLASEMKEIKESQSELGKDFVGATSETGGKSGRVPAPKMGEDDKVLCSNGSWKDIGLVLDQNIPNYPSGIPDTVTWDGLKAWAEDCASGNSDNYRALAQNGASKSVYLPGYGNINMQLVALNNKDRADGQGKAGFTFMSREILTTNIMGDDKNTMLLYSDCKVRTELFSRGGGVISSAVPEEVRRLILKVKIPYAISSASQSGQAPQTDFVEDTFFLPSYMELFGEGNETSKIRITHPPMEGPQFDYFVTHNYDQFFTKSAIAAGINTIWYLRTPYYDSNWGRGFMLVEANGRCNYSTNGNSSGIVLCFCI